MCVYNNKHLCREVVLKKEIHFKNRKNIRFLKYCIINKINNRNFHVYYAFQIFSYYLLSLEQYMHYNARINAKLL